MRSVQIRAIAPLAKRSCLVLMAAGSLSLQAPAFAEDQETVNVDDVVAPLAPGVTSDTVTEDLIRLLTQRNALSHDDAQKLIERLRAAPPSAATPPPAPEAPAAGENPGRVRVPYVPESDKQRIREEVKKEVLETAREERWGVPNTLPLWITRMRLSGDVRVREEFNYFDSANYPYQFNFQAINSASSPINTISSQGVIVPYLNVTEDREMLRLRARFGLETNIADDLIASFRLATGSSSNPVSTNQTLGSDFNKPTLLVDRAYLQYRPLTGLTAWAGRMANPWQSTELVFDEDLNFDGFAAQYKIELGDITPRATFGVFSIENTPSDFPSSNFLKNKSRDKWLFAGQFGADWRVVQQFLVRGAAAYYDFQHVQGKPSVCAVQYSSLPCNSDESRPGFLQKGNTLTTLRIPDETYDATIDPQYQYFGLASPFRVLDLTMTLDWALFSGQHLTLIGDYARNLAYDKKAIIAMGYVNNFGRCGDKDTACKNAPPHRGGSQAYLAEMRFGQPNIKDRGQWNMIGGYRRLATDAVLDAFTDSDFHLGGTNARGYYIGGGIGFTRNAWVNLRWLSAMQASGEPMAIDVLQLDLNARF